jgi:outer membrane protein TolC
MSWDDTMAGADFEGIPSGTADAGRNMNIEWMISQKVPFPGKRFLKGRVASKEARMSEEDYKAKEREIISEVKKAYSDYFLKDHEVMLHEDTKRILERLSKSAEARYATNQISYAEVLRAHTELSVIINEVARHQQERETALARLNSLLGREAGSSLRVSVSVPERKEIYSKEELMKLAVEKRPEYQAMQYGVQAAKLDRTSAWLDLLPDGQFRVEARHYKGENGIREYDQFYGFEVPVLSMLGRIGKIREKHAEKKAAQAASANMKNIVLYEVQKSLAEFESNDRTAKVYRADIVPQAEAAVNSALTEYESGKGNFLMVMEAQRAVTEYRHHYFEALAMREASFAELERMVGADLEGGMIQ